MGRIERRLSHLSALVFALSFPQRVPQLNQQLTPAMHVLREGEQGLPAPQALGDGAHRKPSQTRKSRSWCQLCTSHGRRQQRGVLLFDLFGARDYSGWHQQRLTTAKQPGAGLPRAGMTKRNCVPKPRGHLGSPLSSLLVGMLPLG